MVWVIAFAIGLYPFVCLMVAITGPHSEFERQDMLRQRLAQADRSPKGGDHEGGSIADESPVPEGNAP